MKKGKFIALGVHNKVKIGYGTVDYKNLKTIYIQLKSWTEPNVENYDFNRTILKARKQIRKYLYELDSEYFKPESIVDLDIKTSGIKLNKRSFMDLELTLYVDKPFDVRDSGMKDLMSGVSKNIVDNILVDKNLFNFHEKKN